MKLLWVCAANDHPLIWQSPRTVSPNGPWEIDYSGNFPYVWRKTGTPEYPGSMSLLPHGDPIEQLTKAEVIAVRDALNRVYMERK